jgi:hypothetical protein
MEYCDQGSLAQLIRSRTFWDTARNQPDLRSILTVARHIAAGMAYLHGKHILHGGEGGAGRFAWQEMGTAVTQAVTLRRNQCSCLPSRLTHPW